MDYPQLPRRRGEVLFPPNTLKIKVGSGGIDDDIISNAQKIIDEQTFDFAPVGQRYLAAIQEGVKMAAEQTGRIDDEALIAAVLYPAMQLKANGGMFGFPSITVIAANLIRFLEHLKRLDEDALDVVTGFIYSMDAIFLMGRDNYTLSSRGEEIGAALDEACARYFEKHKD